LLESSRTSGQGTLVKCCPPRAPGERTGDLSPARGLRQGGEPAYEDQPLLGLVGQEPRDPRPPGGRSAMLEERERRRVWGGTKEAWPGVGEPREEKAGEGEEEACLGCRGRGAATSSVQTSGGDKIRGLGHGSSNVRPSGLWEPAPPARALRAWGGLLAMGEVSLC